MEKDRRLSFYQAEILLKSGEMITADAIILPNQSVPDYRFRRPKSEDFEFIPAEDVKKCIITNKEKP